MAEADNSTHCPVCFEPYEETGDRLARLLPCTHTLCHTCVKGLIQADTLVCPQDRQGHPALQGARSFPQNKYILINLKRQGNRQETQAEEPTEKCETHGQNLMFFCKNCKQIICTACIITKHQWHEVIDVLNEKTDVAPLADKLKIYQGKLERTKQELLYEYNENLTKLQNKHEEVMYLVDKRIAEVTRNIDTLKDVKEKANVKATVKETLTKIEVIENITERIKQNLYRPLQYTGHELTDVETIVYLSGEEEDVLSKTIRLVWKGVKTFWLMCIGWMILARVEASLGLWNLHAIVANFVNEIIRLILPSMYSLSVGSLVALALTIAETWLTVKFMRRLNTWFWREVWLQTRVKRL